MVDFLSTLKNSETAAIPFIFLTAKAEKADWRQGMNLGADDYLTKPFTRAELLGAIASRLEKQKTIVQLYNTALKQAAERLNYLLHYDTLTGLPNRLLLRERFQQILQQVYPGEESIMILFLDLNRFSRINETLGHSWGDALLKAVASRLLACVAQRDTVARLSTDQFVIILTCFQWLCLRQFKSG